MSGELKNYGELKYYEVSYHYSVSGEMGVKATSEEQAEDTVRGILKVKYALDDSCDIGISEVVEMDEDCSYLDDGDVY